MTTPNASVPAPETAGGEPLPDPSRVVLLWQWARDLVQDMSRLGARWRMSIPADPDRDYDLIVWEVAAAAKRLSEEVSRLRAEVRQVRADADRWREFTRRVNDGEQAAMAALAVQRELWCPEYAVAGLGFVPERA